MRRLRRHHKHMSLTQQMQTTSTHRRRYRIQQSLHRLMQARFHRHHLRMCLLSLMLALLHADFRHNRQYSRKHSLSHRRRLHRHMPWQACRT